jgi:hypothetical protein
MQQVMNQFHRRTALDFYFRGLKEALNNGISKQVTKLTATDVLDGIYIKILLPEELKKWMD